MKIGKLLLTLTAFVCSCMYSLGQSSSVSEKFEINGNKSFKVSDFENLNSFGPFNVIYTANSDSAGIVRVNITGAVKENIIVYTEGNTLILKLENKLKSKSVFNKDNFVTIYAYSSNINKIENRGSGNINVDCDLNNDKIELNVLGSGDISAPFITSNEIKANIKGSGNISFNGNTESCDYLVMGSGYVNCEHLNSSVISANVRGSGDIKLTNINCMNVSGTVSGSGDIIIEGRAESAEFCINGSGDVKAGKLNTQKTNATIKGSGDVSCNASEHLDVVINGSGDVKYSGTPAIKSKTLGSGKIRSIEQ